MKKKLAAMSWPTRAVLGLLMFVLGSWGSMRLTASGWVESVADADAETNVVDYDASFFRWNGDFGAENVSLTHFMPDGSQGPTYLADRVVFHTPGLHWLWWNSVKGRNKRMPDTFGVSFENLRDAARTDHTPGNYTNLPYDQVGCGPGSALLTIDRLRKMGLAEVRRDVSLSLVRKDDSLSTLTVDLLTHGAGQLTMTMDIGVQRPILWRETLMHFFAAQLKSATVRITDRGFVAMRNAACAKEAGVAPEAFHAHHMKALDSRLAEGQLSFDAAVRSRYGAFAKDGGELVLQGRNLPKMELSKFLAMDRGRKLELGPLLSHNGGPATPFHFQPLMKPEVATVAPAVSAAAVAPASDAPASTPATDDATTTMVAREIGYRDLEGREGEHVEILTRNGTVRRGTLIVHSAYMSTVKLDAEEGGFTMSIPGDSVQAVRVIEPLSQPTDSASAGGASATGAPRG